MTQISHGDLRTFMCVQAALCEVLTKAEDKSADQHVTFSRDKQRKQVRSPFYEIRKRKYLDI
jgi:hypothetical protein